MKVYESVNEKGDDFIKGYLVTLNPNDNGGEAISLGVDIYNNGDADQNHLFNLTLIASCYGTSLSKITMWGVSLDDLEDAIKSIKEKYNKDFPK